MYMCLLFFFYSSLFFFFFFFNDTATTEIYTLSLHDALPLSTPETSRNICPSRNERAAMMSRRRARGSGSAEAASWRAVAGIVCLGRRPWNPYWTGVRSKSGAMPLSLPWVWRAARGVLPMPSAARARQHLRGRTSASGGRPPSLELPGRVPLDRNDFHVSVLVPKHVSDARHLRPGHIRVFRIPVRPDAAARFRDDFDEAFRRRLQDEFLLDLLEAAVTEDMAELLHRLLDVVQLERSPLVGHQKTRTA